MAYLRSIVSRHFPARDKDLRNRLKRLATYSKSTARAAKNLWRDSRPGMTAWKEIVRAVLRAKPDGAKIQEAIRAGIRAAVAFGSVSPLARIPSATTFGRVVEEEGYIRSMFQPKSAMPATPEAQSALFRHLLDCTLEEQQDFLESSPLGRFKMWSTFDKSASSPFAAIPHATTSLRAALGLDEPVDPSVDVLLVFEYSLPYGVLPRIPTVCDAYAGDTWPAYFLPSFPHLHHGYTEPWSGSGMRPRPEVVHDVVNGRCLAAKIRRVIG